ncbi:PaaI family thioesterase [Phenylobacterium sp.]|jgi:acyl-coenzyme A thioesterase PaaI-like protein|uniref:PaaI family thioesterase n=1 Tax=Phenylobacterium sp. TaxID=1871053 RepID=UPI002F3F46C8
MTEPGAQAQPPDGFEPAVSRAPFAQHNGPFFDRASPEGLPQRAFHVLRRHTNGLGVVHGGMLATFMDGVLAMSLPRGGVTVNLSLDYLRMARAGDWIVGESRLLRAAGDLAFVEGRAFVGPHDVVRASGVFKLMRRA